MITVTIRLKPNGFMTKRDVRKIKKLCEQNISFNVIYVTSKYLPPAKVKSEYSF